MLSIKILFRFMWSLLFMRSFSFAYGFNSVHYFTTFFYIVPVSCFLNYCFYWERKVIWLWDFDNIEGKEGTCFNMIKLFLYWALYFQIYTMQLYDWSLSTISVFDASAFWSNAGIIIGFCEFGNALLLIILYLLWEINLIFDRSPW